MPRTEPTDILFEPLSKYFKRCPRCGFQRIEDFNNCSQSIDGLSGYCRMCQANKFDEYRQIHRNRLDTYRRQRYAQNIIAELVNVKMRRQHPIYKQKHRAREAMRRALKQQTETEPIDFFIIWNRDNGMCYLCQQPVIKGTEQYDHITPLSRGGSHTYDNIKVTHRSCNAKKWAKTPKEYLGVQYA